ncbi:hypothetical protein ACOMHN_044441 [Nucella lapillus]
MWGRRGTEGRGEVKDVGKKGDGGTGGGERWEEGGRREVKDVRKKGDGGTGEVKDGKKGDGGTGGGERCGEEGGRRDGGR